MVMEEYFCLSQAVQTAEEAKNLADTFIRTWSSSQRPPSVHPQVCSSLTFWQKINDSHSKQLLISSQSFSCCSISFFTKTQIFQTQTMALALARHFLLILKLWPENILQGLLDPPGNLWRHLNLCKIAHGWNSLQKLLCWLHWESPKWLRQKAQLTSFDSVPFLCSL